MEKLLPILLSLQKLKTAKRAGWLNYGIPDSESVAEHLSGTALIALLLADELGVDKDKLVAMALLHDAAEAKTGDIIFERGEKKIRPAEKRMEEERRVMEELLFDVKDKERLLSLWKEFAQGITKEAIVLKQVDKLDMALQAFSYEKEYGKSLDEFFINAALYIKEDHLRSIFEEILKLREKQ